MKNILFYFGHPSHYHVFKYVIKDLNESGLKTTILIKKKDILEDLLKEENIEYINILPEGRSNSLIGIGYGVLKRDYRLFNYLIRHKHNLLVGSEPSLAHVGKLLGINSLIFAEDDNDVAPLFSKLTYPFCSHIISPEVCDIGKWSYKKIPYSGYQKLSYLHPDVFTPSLNSIDLKNVDKSQPFFLIRLSGLSAYHDKGVKGFDNEMLKTIVENLEKKGAVYISSEKKLPDLYNSYLLDIPLNDIHHLLANAKMLISDSQSMSVEASLLGTPSLRLNDLVGKISVLQELEKKYKLTFGFKPNEKHRFLEKLNELLLLENINALWDTRKKVMLDDKINVNKFYYWLIKEYPTSIKELNSKPEIMENFS